VRGYWQVLSNKEDDLLSSSLIRIESVPKTCVLMAGNK
jgi:hypothetical protein